MKLKIETTADGSPTLYREDLDEHYHSVKGAIAESKHVYLKCGWEAAASVVRPIRVFEVGFGTGLNAALTAQAALESGIPTEYYSVDLYPLPLSDTLQYAESLPLRLRDVFKSVNAARWQQESTSPGDSLQQQADSSAVCSKINPYFVLTKVKANFLTMTLPSNIDVVYFDAFAPEKQPEMWDEYIFRRLYEAMAPGAILTTYCAKGVVRRMLAAVGFIPERLPGPPAGKREILRARRP